MSFKEDLRAAVAEHLELEYGDYIVDVEVTWDAGVVPDPTYGDSLTAPTFNISVLTSEKNNWIQLDTAFTFGALLRAILVERK